MNTKIRRKVAIVSYSDAANDPRILKQIRALENKFDVSVIACGQKPEGNIIKFYEIIVPPIRTSFKSKYIHALSLIMMPISTYLNESINKQVEKILKISQFDLILANDMIFAVCIKYGGNARVIYDAHEYYFDSITTNYGKIKLFAQKRVFKKYGKQCIDGITVSEGLAILYKNLVGKRPQIILNTTWYNELRPKIKEPDDSIRIIHHGGGLRKRKIEQFIELVALLKNTFYLDLMLVIRDDKYKAELQQKIEKIAQGRVKIIEPVPIDKVAQKLNEYDVGIHMLWGNVANHLYAMPNKIFEFIQGRLAVAIIPNPDMKDFMETHNIGIVSKERSLKSMAEALNNLDHTAINRFKINTHNIAEEFCAERAQEKYLNIVDKAIGN